MEMPSVNWEDVADNWFGGCCTSFGGAGEKLVSQFINAYGRLEGTSLLDTTAITIETDYLEADLVAQLSCSAHSSDFVAIREAKSDISIGKDHATEKIKSSAQPQFILEARPNASSSETNGVALQTDQSGSCQMDVGIDVNFEKSKNDCCVEKIEESNKEVDLSLVDPCHCCHVNLYSEKAEDNPLQMSSENQKKQTMLETKRDYKLTKTISLGSSFIVKASKLLNDFDWIELLCGRCSSPLGSYPSQCSLVPSDGRVRLFKCYTSTELPVTGPHDVFRIVDEWSSKYRAEELYMMKRQIDELIECLSSTMDNFPVSCSSLEGMHLSSLRR
nr:unnamed protein product [Digitaria exilis]